MPFSSAKYQFALRCAVLTCCMASQAAADITTGLVGHWKLNETSGTTASDSSGNGRNGTYTNAPTLNQTGQCSTAVSFDGSDDYVTIADNAEFSKHTSTGQTVAGWVKVTTIPSTGTSRAPIAAKGTSSAWEWALYVYRNDSTTWYAGASYWQQSGSTHNEIGYSTTTFTTGTWVHVAMTFAPGVANKLYVNGSLVATGTTFTGSPYDGTRSVQIGRREDGKYLNAVIDDVRVYNRVLSASDIEELYSLRLHWKLDETSGTTATDSSAYENTGTYVGSPTLGGAARRQSGVSFPSNAQYVSRAATSSLNDLGANNADFSVAMWVKPNAGAGTWRPLVHKGSTNLERGPGIWLQPTVNKIHYRISTTYSWNEGTDSITALSSGQWSHVAIIRSGTSYKCYINGALDSTYTIIGTTTGNSGPLYVGDDPWYAGSNVTLDDVRIYRRALTPTEIVEMYGLVGHWKLNETSGTTAGDSSGIGNNGTLNNGPTWTSGARSNALQCDGTNDYVNVPHHASLSLVEDMSFSAWVQTNNLTVAWRTIASKGNNYYFDTYGDEVSFGFHDGTSWVDFTSTNVNLKANTWYHFAATFDNSTNQVTLYVNGVAVLSGSTTSVPVANTSTFSLGSWSGTEYFSGAIDDVRVYNRVIDATEVLEQYGLVGRWKLDETSGTTASDSSGMGFHGTYTNSPTIGQPGVYDYAMSADGTDDYVAVTERTPLRTTEAVTMSAWVKPSATANAVRMIVNKEGEYEVALTAAGEVQWAFTNTTPGWAWHTTGAFVSNNMTSHIVVTYDSGTAKTYVNGILKETYAGAGNLGDAHKALNDLRIAGRSNNPANQYLIGLVDEVRVYNRAITATEVAELYGLLGHWKFNEAAGTTAADSSGLASSASLTGATWTSDCAGHTAAAFNGVGDVAATTSSFDPPGTGAVAFWMRGSGLPAARQRLFGISGNWEARLETTGLISFDLGASPFVGNEPFASTDVTGLDRWYHVVAQFNQATDAYSVYIDGELTASGTSPVNLVDQAAGTLSFGTRTGSSEYWEGALRDFRIYDRYLQNSEISELSGLLAHWKLNESSGVAADDSAAAGNDATYVGSPTLGVTGSNVTTNGTAVDLNGTSQYVSAGQSLLNNRTEFSLSLWVRPDNTTPDKSFIGQNGLVELGIDTLTNQIDLWTSGGGSVSATHQLPTGKWSHVVAVGAGAGLKIYVDGVELAAGGSSCTSYGSNSSTFKVGEGVLAATGDYFDGRIDDVRVFGRAMCAEEVLEIYQGGRSPGVRIIKWLETR